MFLITTPFMASANPLCESAQNHAAVKYSELQAAQATGNQAQIQQAFRWWIAAERAVTIYCMGQE